MGSTAQVVQTMQLRRALLDTANAAWDGSGSGLKTLFDASADGPALAEWIQIAAQEDTTAQLLKFFTDDGTTKMLLDWLLIPARTITAGVQGPFKITLYPSNFPWLAAGFDDTKDLLVVSETSEKIAVTLSIPKF